MTGGGAWVGDANQALLTDLYQLAMVRAYWHEGMREKAVFTLFSRRLPDNRNYLLACGLADGLHFLEMVRFSEDSIDYLASLPHFTEDFLVWLRDFRFTGDVYAVPEGTPFFANEPILEVVAPIAEAQLAETFLMNQIHFQTVVASKASRIVTAAAGLPVVDFGLRRMHGADAGLKSARAFHIAGVSATSNLLAGRTYGVPVAGTMAHSYIQAHDDEIEAFRAFNSLYPQTILLVDTYDSMEGVRKVIALAKELGNAFRVRGIRLDSGDLHEISCQARQMLDAAHLQRMEIFASGGLDEFEIESLISRGAPIDGFGVGTGMGVSSDAPALDLAYKLSEYAGVGRLKTSPGKPILPGRKQVFREEEEGMPVRDVIGRWGEDRPGRPLLRLVMQNGSRVPGHEESLTAARERARMELDLLPERLRGTHRADPDYPVEISPALRSHQQAVIAKMARRF